MKLVHFADAHIGVATYSSKVDNSGLPARVVDHLHAVDQICDYVIGNNIDVVLFAGDAFHRFNPAPIYQLEFARRVVRMADHSTVVLLIGNHDLSGGAYPTSVLDIYDELGANNIVVCGDYEVICVDGIQIATFPYPSKRSVLGSDTARGWEKRLRQECRRLLKDLADAIDPDIPSVLLGHMTVEGASSGSEREMFSIIESDVLLEDLVGGPWDYVALGHIHRHQCLWDDPPIVYSGSVERVFFGEEGEEKGFCVVDLDDLDRQTWMFVPLEIRDMLTIPVDLVATKSSAYDARIKYAINKHKDRISNSIVRVVLNVPERYVSLVNMQDVYQLLTKAFHCQIKVHTVAEERKTRLTKDAVSLPDADLLATYLDPLVEDDDEYNRLMELAEDIMASV